LKGVAKKPKEPSIFLDLKHVESWFVTRDRPYVTYLLIAANVIAYVGTCVVNKSIGFEFEPQDLIGVGANWAALTLKGQYWRLLTACFLHAGWFHIASNLLALYWVGQVCENLFGHLRMLIIYIATGVASSLSSILYSFIAAEITAVLTGGDPAMQVAVGASGAIMGLVGAYVAALVVHRHDFSEKLAKEFRGEFFKFIILVFLFGIPIHADQGAHFGGLLGGFVIGYFILPRSIDKAGLRQVDVVTMVISAAFCVVLFVIESTGVLDFQNTLAIGNGTYLMLKGDYGAAIEVAKRELESHPKNRLAVELLAMNYYQNHQYTEALAECRRSLKMGVPNSKDYLLEAEYCHRLQLYSDEIVARQNAAKLDPQIADSESKIADANFMKSFAAGDFKSAMSYAGSSFRSSPTSEKKAYMAFFYTVASRLGHLADSENLLTRSSQLSLKQEWTKSVLAFESGKIDGAELMKRATATDVDKQTEAHTYIGFDELTKGHAAAAHEDFKWVVDKGNKDFVEYDLVKLQLQRSSDCRSDKVGERRPI
jgi:membrane associated rhomboid family serine protease/tetratricopeptide (TPR) repeat protein